MDKRMKVLKAALILENLTSGFLAGFLNIDYKYSKSLGNTSSALSFNSKINLLLDIKHIEKEDVKKLGYFMSIRNQFMHNLNAKSFEDCFGLIDGLGTKMLKIYIQEEKLSLEEKYENCFDKLVEDLWEIISKLTKKLNHDLREKAKKEVSQDYYKIFQKSIFDTTNEFDEVIEQKILESEKGDYSQFKGLGKLFKTMIIGRVLKLVKEDRKSEE